MKKIIALILCFLMILSVCSIPAFAENNIVASGKCGESEKDNVNWTLNKTGEIKISGEGTANLSLLEIMDGNNVWSIEFEEGITEINGGLSLKYSEAITRIIIPISVGKINSFLGCNTNIADNKKIAVCYKGTETEWEKINFLFEDGFDKNKCVFFWDGEIPDSFCGFDSDTEKISLNLYYDNTLWVNYFKGEHKDAKFRYTFDKSFFSSSEATGKLTENSFISLMPKRAGNTNLKVELVENGKSIAEDTIQISIKNENILETVKRLMSFQYFEFLLSSIVTAGFIGAVLSSPYDMVSEIIMRIKEYMKNKTYNYTNV